MSTEGLSSNMIMVKTLAFCSVISIEFVIVVRWRDLFVHFSLSGHCEDRPCDGTRTEGSNLDV
jgi:hypothetical protein